MAYCPLAQAGRLRDGLFQHTDIINMANARGVTAAQLLLAWVIRHPGVLAIPKAASIEHVVQNAAALISSSAEELAQLDRLSGAGENPAGYGLTQPIQEKKAPTGLLR
jgi:diketogulonate reductase-like aldo/keto reductase